METKDIFISYASDDVNAAKRLYSALENNGLSCWMALTSIPGGTDFADEIAQAIKGCKIFIVLISRKSQASQWVRKELNLAIQNNKKIMPFRLENCALTGANELRLSDVQWYEAYPNYSVTVRKMIETIRDDLNLPEAPRGKASPSSAGYFPGSYQLGKAAGNVTQALYQAARKLRDSISKRARIQTAVAAALFALFVLGNLASILVSNLTLKRIDVFEDIHVTVEGAAPYAEVRVASTSADPFVRNIHFSVTPDTDLKSGDTVIITANVSPADAKEYGYRLASDTMEYTLTDLNSYITSVELLNAADVTAIRDRAAKFIDDRGTGYPRIVMIDGSTIDISADNLANCLTDITFLEEGYVDLSVPLFDVEAVLVVPFRADIQGVEYTWFDNIYYEDPISKDFIDLYGYFRFTGLKLDPDGNLIKEDTFGLEMSRLFEDKAAMERDLFDRFDSLVSGTFQQ